MRAEGEQVAAASASGDAGRIVICVRVSLGAGSFENPGICCGLARLRVAEAPSTAVSGGVERKARALARHHALLVMRSDLKPYRAHHVQVTNAPGVAALPCNVKCIYAYESKASLNTLTNKQRGSEH